MQEEISKYDPDGEDMAANSFDNFDSFDSFDSFDTFSNQVKLSRQRGEQLLNGMDRFLQDVERKAQLSGEPAEVIQKRLLLNNPDAVNKLQDYVHRNGYNPSPNLEHLAMQVAHVRGEQIAAKQRKYTPDVLDNMTDEHFEGFCFSGENFEGFTGGDINGYEGFDNFEPPPLPLPIALPFLIFSKKARHKYMERLRRLRDMLRRRKQAGENIPDSHFDQLEQQEAKVSNMMIPDSPRQQNSATNWDSVNDVSNPSAREAHAEIIGDEFGGDSYRGEADNFLPLIATAIALGSRVVQGIQAAKKAGIKISFNDIGKLFKKGAFKNITPEQAAALTAGQKAPDPSLVPPAKVLDEGIKQIVSGVEKEKKKEFLQENAGLIFVGVLVLIFLGRMSK